MSPEKPTPPNSIDFVEVNNEEALAAGSPAEQPKTPEEQKELDKKFAVISTPSSDLEIKARTKQILETIVKDRETGPEQALTKASDAKLQSMNTEPKPEELSLSDFMKKFGSRDLKRDIKNGVKGYDHPSGIALDIYSKEVPLSMKAASAAAIPCLAAVAYAYTSIIASAGGVGAFVAATGLAAPIFLGIPVIGSGLVAYTGYKMFKSWNAKRAFKKNFGKSVNETLGHA